MAVGVLKYSTDGGATWVPMLGGPQGIPGEGVPVGGTTDQVLTKNSSTDHDASWKTSVSDTFITSNVPTTWASGLYVMKSGKLVNVSGPATCLLGHFLPPAGGGTIVLGIVPVGSRPEFATYGTCMHLKGADANYRKYLVASVQTNGEITIWPDTGAGTYQFYATDSLSLSITYRIA